MTKVFQVDGEPPDTVSSEDSVENVLKDFSKQASTEIIIHSDGHCILGSSFLRGCIFLFITSHSNHSQVLVIEVIINHCKVPLLISPLWLVLLPCTLEISIHHYCPCSSAFNDSPLPTEEIETFNLASQVITFCPQSSFLAL